MMRVGRNDLCPCGSGLKYKKCHMLIDLGEAPSEGASNGLNGKVLGGVIAAGVLVGLGVGQSYGAQTGIAVGGGIIALAVAWSVFRDPPPPKSGGDDPAAINFGTTR